MSIESGKKYEVVLPPWMNLTDIASSPTEDASDKFRAKHFRWGEVNGEVVFVLSVTASTNYWGGEDQAKVYCITDDYTEWFKVTVSLLQELAVKAPDPVCSCDLTLLMNRGCKCGASGK